MVRQTPPSILPQASRRSELLDLLDNHKISLVRAARMLNIPFHQAKQMLFVFGSPRRHALMESRSPNITSIRDFKRRSAFKRVQAKPSTKNEDSSQFETLPRNVIHAQRKYCSQCKCYCCPYAQMNASEPLGANSPDDYSRTLASWYPQFAP